MVTSPDEIKMKLSKGKIKWASDQVVKFICLDWISIKVVIKTRVDSVIKANLYK